VHFIRRTLDESSSSPNQHLTSSSLPLPKTKPKPIPTPLKQIHLSHNNHINNTNLIHNPNPYINNNNNAETIKVVSPIPLTSVDTFASLSCERVTLPEGIISIMFVFQFEFIINLNSLLFFRRRNVWLMAFDEYSS
jgi:hypothetical protein